MKILPSKILMEPAEEPANHPRPALPAEQPIRVPPVDLKEQMKSLLQEFTERAVRDMHTLESKLDETQAIQTEHMMKHTQTIARIFDEIDALKKDIAKRFESACREAPAPTHVQASPTETPRPDPKPPELVKMPDLSQKTPEPVKTEPVKTEPVKTEPVKTEPINAVFIKTEPIKAVPKTVLQNNLTGPAPVATPAVKKVAFLTKLWDYLNTAAFESPNGQQKP